ncbi:MAG: metallophosphoesterase [Flavobacteriaceae bacterium]|nr:metallophosphoesterase [Flavobacteriaceae bacterium]
MRTFSLFTILLLCAAILIIDILAFYWLRSITDLIDSSALVELIHVVFWVFTAGLISAIIILKVRLDDISPKRKQWMISRFYGLAISSFIPKLIFVIIISILYFTNFVIAKEESLLVVPLVGLLSGVLPFIVIVYGIFKAAYRYKVHHIQINSSRIPKAFSGLRIIQISDLHLGSFNSRYKVLDNAISMINQTHPDLIVFTGDIVNNFAWELKGWDKKLDQLSAKKAKFAVLGNHDYGDYSQWDCEEEKLANSNDIKDFFKKIDFKLLLNDSVFLEKDNEQLAVIGVENWGDLPFKKYGDLEVAMQGADHAPFKILLSHDPTHWAKEVRGQTDIDLTLSGHTHGMQAGIQYKNINWSPIKYKYEHWGGLYSDGDQHLYVNRGMGWLGFPGRLGMRPEITQIDLVRISD